MGKPGVTLSSKIRKKFPNSKSVEVTIFSTNIFHQRWFFSNVECNFDKASKIFSLKIHRFAAQIPKTTKKSGLFWNDKKFFKMFLCTCTMQLWQPCQNFLVKTLKTFCSNSGNDEKKTFQETYFSSKCSSEQVQRNFDKTAVNLSPKIRMSFL